MGAADITITANSSVSESAQTMRGRITTLGLRAGQRISDDAFATIHRRMVLEFCKWDPQVGDVSTIAPFPLLMAKTEWAYLAESAERLARELMELEIALMELPDLQRELGLPRILRRLLANGVKSRLQSPATRVIRFDFHPTLDGWRIS